ncbi:hypothetical protein KU891_29105 (plasmid) [Bacillus tropicus]|uniref:hypothetical protein n=1 Tax=Bacillus tropicus TaxID=2026188 RepID=UPI00200608FF|nr:hypothetical protein [Bacillus tropicus]UOK49472.1 hypothetical protein KU891_29105 [Bacillus tropicus]
MEQTFEVRPFGVKYICDSCGEGEMLHTGEIKWRSSPPELAHECNQCGHKEYFHDKYPLIRWESL